MCSTKRREIMKNRKLMAVVSVIIVLTLVACGNAAENATVAEENTGSETSANDLLVNSLEYLLSEDDKTPSEEGQAPEDVEQRTDSDGAGHCREADRCFVKAQYRVFGNKGQFF